MNSFERFQNRNRKRMVANDNLNTNFIFKGYPSTEIKNKIIKNNILITTKVNATVVNEQEKDKAYIYTMSEDPLDVGSV